MTAAFGKQTILPAVKPPAGIAAAIAPCRTIGIRRR